MASKTASEKTGAITEEQVKAFLKTHPDFLKKNSDVVTDLAPPERELGNGIIDFQHYMVKNLQKGASDLKSRYDVLVDFCRDNMSVQAQVHGAALRLIRAKNFEQLLEAVTLDLVSLFDVDVVRLAMESDEAHLHDRNFSEAHPSGIVLIPTGTVDAAIGHKKNVLLSEDCQKKSPAGFSDIFADCEEMTASCALLRLNLEQVKRPVILAFGVRHQGRFHPGQGIELLHFLAQIVAHQLDVYLFDLTE